MSIQGRKAQRGASLVFILLLVMGVLILATISGSSAITSERGSANARDADLAQQAAESALRAAEAVAGASGPSDGNANCDSTAGGSTGICNLASNGYRLSASGYAGLTMAEAVHCPSSTSACSGAASIMDASPSIAFNTGNAALSQQPRYIIEVLPAAVPGEESQNIVYLFRITAKGWGQSASTQKVVQSVYYPPR